MASLLTHSHGSKAGAKYIRFFRNGKREMIYLGKVPDRFGDTVLRHVEDLISAKAGGMAPAPATAKWLTTIDAALSKKLVDADLIEQPTDNSAAATRLDGFISDYIKTLNIKAGTRFNLDLARRNLVEFFGDDKLLKSVTPADADEFRRWLARPTKNGGKGLDVNTVRRRCGRAKQFFRAAARKKLIAESPFADMKDCKVSGNAERFYFVPQADAEKVLLACPDNQWRALFALCRYGGLRCPSEHTGLRWSDIDWDNNRFTVRSPKTEHHEGHESRVVPLFPELRPHLEAARNEAAKDAEYVITIPAVVRSRRSKEPAANLGTRMQKIIKLAGLKVWPKLFHNLRATRQTELTQAGHPERAVCQWLGNSQAVAREHYLRVTDADFAKATGQWEPPGEPQAAQNGRLNGSTPSAAGDSLLLQIVQKALENSGPEQVAATLGKALREYEMTPRGLEPLSPP